MLGRRAAKERKKKVEVLPSIVIPAIVEVVGIDVDGFPGIVGMEC